ncbi:hypothetical protein Tco_0232161, partial [Tanacetum coccineum]
ESDKAEFSNMYDILLQECVSNDVMCSYLHSLSDLDAHAELQCVYVHKAKECECLAQKLYKQTEILKKLIEKNKGKGVDTNFEKKAILGKPPLQPIRNQPVPPMESVGSNDMVHNYYLEEAKKKAQIQKDKALNTKPSVQQSARLPNTTNGNKPKPRNINQQPKNWPPSMSSRVSNRTVNTAKPPRNQKYKQRCCSIIPTESDSLPHAHAQTTKTYYKHQDLRIKKDQELKTKTSAYFDIKNNSSETKLQRRLLESFQEDAKYEHVGQDTRSQMSMLVKTQDRKIVETTRQTRKIFKELRIKVKVKKKRLKIKDHKA